MNSNNIASGTDPEVIEILSDQDEEMSEDWELSEEDDFVRIVGDVEVIDLLEDDEEGDELADKAPGAASADAGAVAGLEAVTRVMQPVVDLNGTQPECYAEQQIQRNLYNMYVDGSYRPDSTRWPLSTRMSAGGFCAQPTGGTYSPRDFNFSCLLLGGQPDSLRAELGAIWVGCTRLSQAADRGLLSASDEVHLYTDCQSAAVYLKRASVKPAVRYLAIVTGIKEQLRQLRAKLPVRLRWIKGHQADRSKGHGQGNHQAHCRAQPSRVTSAIHLPSGQAHVLGDPSYAAAAAAALRELRATLVRPAVHNQRGAQPATQASSGLHLPPVVMKRPGKKARKRLAATAALQARYNTRAHAATVLHTRLLGMQQQDAAHRAAAARAAPAAAPFAVAVPSQPPSSPICIDC